MLSTHISNSKERKQTYEVLQNRLDLQLTDQERGRLTDRVGLDEVRKDGQAQANVEVSGNERMTYHNRRRFKINEKARSERTYHLFERREASGQHQGLHICL